MKKIIISISAAAFFLLAGCVKPSDNIHSFRLVPAIYDFNATFEPVLITTGITLLAPEMRNAEGIVFGDAVIAFFDINYDQQPYANQTLVSNLQVAKIDTFFPIYSDGGATFSEDFEDLIEEMGIIGFIEDDWIGTYMFLEFIHMAPIDLAVEYEMTYDLGTEDRLPTLYIRSKISGESSLNPALYLNYAAFNLTGFISNLKNQERNSFNILFNFGDDDGEEFFVPWTGNPFLLEP